MATGDTGGGWFSRTFLGTESSDDKRADYLENRKQGDYEDYATGWGQQADKFQQMGDEFFDPMSGRNQQRYGMMESAIQDQTSSGIRDWQASMAQQGGPAQSGGIASQNILQARRRAGGDAARGMGRAYQQSFGMGMQAAKMGSSERSKGATATGAADQIYAGANQAKMAQDTSNAQKKAGFAQMLGGAAMSYMGPGLMSGLTGALSKYGGSMGQAIAQPHIQQGNLRDASQMNLMRQLSGEGAGGQSFAQNYNLQRPSSPGVFNTQGSLTQGLMNYGMQSFANRQAPGYNQNFGGQAPNPYQIAPPNFHGPAQGGVTVNQGSQSSLGPGYDPNWTY